MAKSSRRTEVVRGRESKFSRTSGEIFSDGSVIELVSCPTENRLQLLLWQSDRKKIAPQIEFRKLVYKALDLDESLRRAIRFPSDAEDFGTTSKLFDQIRILFGRYLGLASPEAALLTAWVSSSWFSDCLSSPPTLVIAGPETSVGITALRLLSCLCRRSLVLADLNRASLLSVMSLHPTLLVNLPSWSLKFSELCRASNRRNVYVVGSGGKVHSLAGSKALFVGMADAESEEAIHLSLPALRELPTLDDKCATEIAKTFQGQLLMNRLRDFDRVRKSGRDVLAPNSPTTELAQNLMICVANEPDILQAVGPILQCQGEDLQARRRCDVSIVMIEALWASLHDAKEITVSELAEHTNALLRVRGENLVYSAVELGWKLRNLGLDRRRNGGGMVLHFSQANSVQIHRLAKEFGLKLPLRIGCTNCIQRETPAT